MIALTPQNSRPFFTELFLRPTFDNFLLAEGSFATAFVTSVDGSLQRSGGNTAETASAAPAESYIRWEVFRPIALSLLKTGEASCGFHVVLMLSRLKTAEFLTATRSDFQPEEVGGLYINLKYQGEKLSVTTGCALKQFSLDRSLEKAWDKQVERFLEPFCQ